jgi:hypothetical protein
MPLYYIFLGRNQSFYTEQDVITSSEILPRRWALELMARDA